MFYYITLIRFYTTAVSCKNAMHSETWLITYLMQACANFPKNVEANSKFYAPGKPNVLGAAINIPVVLVT
jgi:hypothetical protein